MFMNTLTLQKYKKSCIIHTFFLVFLHISLRYRYIFTPPRNALISDIRFRKYSESNKNYFRTIYNYFRTIYNYFRRNSSHLLRLKCQLSIDLQFYNYVP